MDFVYQQPLVISMTSNVAIAAAMSSYNIAWEVAGV